MLYIRNLYYGKTHIIKITRIILSPHCYERPIHSHDPYGGGEGLGGEDPGEEGLGVADPGEEDLGVTDPGGEQRHEACRSKDMR